MLAIERFTRRRVKDPAAIDAFIASHTFPLHEGSTTTIVFRGTAEAVEARHWIYGLPDGFPMHRVGGTDLWYVSVELPPRARIEYRLRVVRDGSDRLLLDPLNPRVAMDPFGGNSVCETPGYQEPDWVRPDPAAAAGTLDDLALSSRIHARTRAVRIYRPHGFRRQQRYPLLVVHDGDDYLAFSAMKTVLDNLIHRREVAPLVVAFTSAAERLEEYAASRRHATHLADEVVPALERVCRLSPHGRGFMGASFGAVASLSAAWYRPGSCDRLLLQSGSFATAGIGPSGGGPEFGPVSEWMAAFRRHPGRPAERIHVDCGIYESLIHENRSLVPLLQATGAEVRYVEARDGHNWQNWRDRMRAALGFLFPGPQPVDAG